MELAYRSQPDALVVDTEGATGREQRTFGDGPLKAFAERDTLWNGLGLGAMAGLGAAQIATAAACRGCDDRNLLFLVNAAWAVPGGAAAGAIVDLLRQPELRVEYDRATSVSAFSIGPWVGTRVRGVYVAVLW